MKQEALAEQLGISQAFVSRLENGQADPDGKLAARITEMVDDPAGRSVFEHVLDSVRFSPHVQCVIEPSADGISYVALSIGFRDHPQFQGLEEGMRVREEASEEGRTLIKDLLESGAFSGDIESLDILWRAVIDDQDNFWRSINTPIRTTGGGWYLHCSMVEMSQAEFQALLEQRGTPMIVTAYH